MNADSEDKRYSGVLRFAAWQNDDCSFERTAFDKFELMQSIQAIVTSNKLADEEYDTLMAIFCALFGRHPHFKLTFTKATSGKDFVRVKKLNADKKMLSAVDFIEVKVALGVKQEAAIAEAISKFDISRRGAFRALEEIRAIRASQAELGYLPDCPDGFSIGLGGRLVPNAG